jgi:hypothetical protein
MVARPFRSRKPKSSPLWKCFHAHFDHFTAAYPRDYQSRYGVLRGVIPEVVDKFMGCGDFAKGFARVRCDECNHEYLLAFSCKGRWFCPSCHQKKVQVFGAMLAESIVAVVPHRHFTFTIPKMLRPYFRFHRGLLKQLCRIAHQCVSDFQRDAFGDANGVGTTVHDGVPAIVMAIHTFGEYLDFHPHLHALVADGLFDREGKFHVMRAGELTGELAGELAQEQRGTSVVRSLARRLKSSSILRSSRGASRRVRGAS